MPFLRALKFLTLALTIFVIHIFFINFFPFPINRVNIIFLFLLWLILLDRGVKIYWLAFLTVFMSEQFINLPYGASAAATLIAFVVINWFLTNILTNRNGYIVFLSAAGGLLLFRCVFFFFLFLFNLFARQKTAIGLDALIDFAWEAGLTAPLLTIIYFGAARVIKTLNPMYVSARKQIYE